ncbi:MAG: EipA family protein [Pseudomonadota bacterium]
MLRVVLALLLALATPAAAFEDHPRAYAGSTPKVSGEEILHAGHNLFGTTTHGLAAALQNILSRFGPPDGYIVGEEGAAAFFGGLRYGEGALQLAGQAPTQIFWQGPSVGWDFGGSGSRVMMLVYNARSPRTLLQRFTGVDGSAYLVGGVSMTVMAAHESYLVPVRTGVGARLGVSLGYLKFTDKPTWNPF